METAVTFATGTRGLEGCTPIDKYPDRTHLDAPVDPAYYTRGDLDIWIDIARFPSYANVWDEGSPVVDDGSRVAMSMEEAVDLMNTHVAPYFERISQGRFRVTFRAGLDIDLHEKGARPEGPGGSAWRGPTCGWRSLIATQNGRDVHIMVTPAD